MSTVGTNFSIAASGTDVTRAALGASSRTNKGKHDLTNRKVVGEFVGNIFYGTLIKEMQASKLKGTVMHGGRGEDVFNGQLAMMLAKKIGQSPHEPLSNRIYQSITKRAANSATAGGSKAVKAATTKI